MSYAHPSTAANSGRKVVSAPTQNIAGETAIEQLLAEEESARAKTASKKAKRQRQQQKKRTQSSLSKTGLENQPVQLTTTALVTPCQVQTLGRRKLILKPASPAVPPCLALGRLAAAQTAFCPNLRT